MSAHARGRGIGDDDLAAVELALTEALSNVMRHSLGGDPAREIRLELRIDDRRLQLELVDDGEPFEESAHDEPDLDSPRAGGYGLYLMRELVDEVARERRAPRGTCLTLTKYLRGHQDG